MGQVRRTDCELFVRFFDISFRLARYCLVRRVFRDYVYGIHGMIVVVDLTIVSRLLHLTNAFLLLDFRVIRLPLPLSLCCSRRGC